MGEKRNVYRLLAGEPEVRRPLGRSGCRWVHNIKMDLVERELGDLTGLVWPRVGTVVEFL
jgi:hypothetical protein